LQHELPHKHTVELLLASSDNCLRHVMMAQADAHHPLFLP